MIPNHLALVPVNSYQLAAIQAISAVEDKIQRGKKLGQYPYARELFRHLCGSEGAISASDVRRATPNYDPKKRRGATKEGYIRALDALVASGGELCAHPLTSNDGHTFFPEVRNRQRTYRKAEVKATRQVNQYARERQQKRRRYQVQVAQAEIDLAFITPSELAAWYKRQERQGIHDEDLIGMAQVWSQRFTNVLRRSFGHGQPLWAIVGEMRGELESRNEIEQWLDALMLPNKLEG